MKEQIQAILKSELAPMCSRGDCRSKIDGIPEAASAIEELIQKAFAGQVLYNDLAKRIIGRVMEAGRREQEDIELKMMEIIAERDSLRAEKLNAQKPLADRLYDSDQASWAIEGALDDIWPDYVDHIGWDHYDRSIEIYFDLTTPADFAATSEQLVSVWQMGFARAYLNFADGTEQHCNPSRTGERVAVAHPRWSKEAHGERSFHVDRIVKPLEDEIGLLRADSTRLDWLHNVLEKYEGVRELGEDVMLGNMPIRDAIDKAMQAEKQLDSVSS